jgi:hypothetical protein
MAFTTSSFFHNGMINNRASVTIGYFDSINVDTQRVKKILVDGSK